MRNRLYGAIVDHAYDMIYTRLKDGRFLSVNKAGVNITGYTEREFTNLSLIDIVAPKYREPIRKVLNRETKGHQDYRNDMVILAKDGHPIEMEFTTCVIRSPDKRPLIVGIGRDVTEPNKARTAAVWHQAAAVFAHLIGNALLPAQSRLNELRQTTAESPWQRDSVAVAYDAVTYAQRIGADFRKHCLRTEMKRDFYDRAIVHAFVQEYCAVAWPQARFRFDWDSNETFRLRVNLDALRDVLAALVSDSIAFHPVHHPHILIRSRKNAYNKAVVITYEDDGPGIDSNVKSRVFELFFSARGGTGVALTDVEAVIRGHRGTITEVGKPGVGLGGVCFEITLPTY